MNLELRPPSAPAQSQRTSSPSYRILVKTRRVTVFVVRGDSRGQRGLGQVGSAVLLVEDSPGVTGAVKFLPDVIDHPNGLGLRPYCTEVGTLRRSCAHLCFFRGCRESGHRCGTAQIRIQAGVHCRWRRWLCLPRTWRGDRRGMDRFSAFAVKEGEGEAGSQL